VSDIKIERCANPKCGALLRNRTYGSFCEDCWVDCIPRGRSNKGGCTYKIEGTSVLLSRVSKKRRGGR
jgi:hypothetical protein